MSIEVIKFEKLLPKVQLGRPRCPCRLRWHKSQGRTPDHPWSSNQGTDQVRCTARLFSSLGRTSSLEVGKVEVAMLDDLDGRSSCRIVVDRKKTTPDARLCNEDPTLALEPSYLKFCMISTSVMKIKRILLIFEYCRLAEIFNIHINTLIFHRSYTWRIYCEFYSLKTIDDKNFVTIRW